MVTVTTTFFGMSYKKQCSSSGSSSSSDSGSSMGPRVGGGLRLPSTSEERMELQAPRQKPRPGLTPKSEPRQGPEPAPGLVCCNTCNDVVDVVVTKTKVGSVKRRSGEKQRLCNNSRSRSRNRSQSQSQSQNQSSSVPAEEMAIRVGVEDGIGVGPGLGDGVCNCQGSRWSRRRVKSKSFCSLFPQDPDYLNRIVVVSLLLLSSFAFLPGFVTGLQCYECLSLQCDSRIVCESIKDSITRTFVPNSHYIHFDPRILCPGPDVPTNASEWEAVTFNCSRSDSLCLEAPVEVITSFDGLRDGKKLDPSSKMTSLGFLRGCASRRGLNELEVTISVRKIYMDNDTWEHFTEYNHNKHNKHSHNHINKFESEQYNDGYKITRVHYHEIYVDHGTTNATRCYMDDCNNRKKLRVRSMASRLQSFGLGPGFNFEKVLGSFKRSSLFAAIFNFHLLMPIFLFLLR